MWPHAIPHKERSLTKNWGLTMNRYSNIPIFSYRKLRIKNQALNKVTKQAHFWSPFHKKTWYKISSLKIFWVSAKNQIYFAKNIIHFNFLSLCCCNFIQKNQKKSWIMKNVILTPFWAPFGPKNLKSRILSRKSLKSICNYKTTGKVFHKT